MSTTKSPTLRDIAEAIVSARKMGLSLGYGGDGLAEDARAALAAEAEREKVVKALVDAAKTMVAEVLDADGALLRPSMRAATSLSAALAAARKAGMVE